MPDDNKPLTMTVPEAGNASHVSDLSANWRQLFDCLGDDQRRLLGVGRFNKPTRLPNIEKLKAFWAELDRTTVIVPITRIQDARTLRTMSEAARGFAVHELGELSTEAREAFAWIVDELQEYNDVGNFYTMSERLDLDRDIGTQLKTIADAGAAFGAGLKHESVPSKSETPNSEPMNLTNIHFVLAPNDALPSNIREPKIRG